MYTPEVVVVQGLLVGNPSSFQGTVMPSVITGRDLGRAICKHFGIDTEKHVVSSDFEIKAEPGTPVTVKLTLMLTADDLAGIARAASSDAPIPQPSQVR